MRPSHLRNLALAALVVAVLVPASATLAQEPAPNRPVAKEQGSAPAAKEPVKVTFFNPLKKDVHLYLIHPKTLKPEYRGTVKTGGELTLACHAGHRWAMSLGDKWLQTTTGQPIFFVAAADGKQHFTIPASEVKVTFSNPLKSDVQLFIMDPATRTPTYRGTVPKGEKLTLACYPGHQWIMGSGKTWFRTLAGGPVYYEATGELAQQFTVPPPEVAITFKNTLKESVSLYIVHTHSGQPDFRGAVEPGTARTLPCYPGHQWVMGAGKKWVHNSQGQPLSYSATETAAQHFTIGAGTGTNKSPAPPVKPAP